MATPKSQIEASTRYQQKARDEGSRRMCAMVSPETVAAAEHLRKTTPGGFNFRQFVEDKIMEEAKDSGYEP